MTTAKYLELDGQMYSAWILCEMRVGIQSIPLVKPEREGSGADEDAIKTFEFIKASGGTTQW